VIDRQHDANGDKSGRDKLSCLHIRCSPQIRRDAISCWGEVSRSGLTGQVWRL
jgi:hypothetical protein